MYLCWNNPVAALLGELSVYERFEAMKQFGSNSNILAHKGYVMVGWAAIVGLLILLAVVRTSRLKREQTASQKRFDEYADRLRLSEEERSVVEAVSMCAGIRHKDSIFTVKEAFDSGLKQLMQHVCAVNRDPAERQKLHRILFSVKEKLGFARSGSENGLTNRLGKEKTTRQIPVGTTLSICLLRDQSESWIPAEVVQNGTFEMTLLPKYPILCEPGDLWKVRYPKAAVIWEFESVTMDYSQKGLELNHSERIRYVNRRRFERICMEQPAKIAPFPVFEQAGGECDMDLTFSPAVIKEIAGTGLRIATDLAVSIHQRVLMIFQLGSDRIVRDVGEVRDIREDKEGCSIIVELIGFNTKSLNEFMRTVNQMTPVPAASPENTDVLDGCQESAQ